MEKHLGVWHNHTQMTHEKQASTLSSKGKRFGFFRHYVMKPEVLHSVNTSSQGLNRCYALLGLYNCAIAAPQTTDCITPTTMKVACAVVDKSVYTRPETKFGTNISSPIPKP